MKTLALLIIAIVFLAGCINQAAQMPDTTENTTPPAAPGNVTPPENVSPQTPPPTNPPPVTPPKEPKTFDVSIRNFVYSLTTTTIKVGDSVRWTNFDVVAHTATADDGSFDTGLLNKDESKTITFSTSGTFDYHCTPHPWMKGKIVVE